MLMLKILFIKKAVKSTVDNCLLPINVHKTKIHLFCCVRSLVEMQIFAVWSIVSNTETMLAFLCLNGLWVGDQTMIIINALVIVLKIKHAELALGANDWQTMNRNDITRFCALCLQRKLALYNIYCLSILLQIHISNG